MKKLIIILLISMLFITSSHAIWIKDFMVCDSCTELIYADESYYVVSVALLPEELLNNDYYGLRIFCTSCFDSMNIEKIKDLFKRDVYFSQGKGSTEDLIEDFRRVR